MFNRITRRFTMNSKNANRTDLSAQLLQLCLKAAAQGLDDLIARAAKSRWSPQVLLEELAREELRERSDCSLQQRLRRCGSGRFWPLWVLDWIWPVKIDRAIIERALTLVFFPDGRNLILLGTIGLGKTMIA
jgi:DNA replication protein DnaC